MEGAKVWEWPLQHNDGVVPIINDSNRFECDLEMPTFRAQEIDVKVMNDELIVHCSQEREAGRMPREIHRTYHLPKDVDFSTLRTSLNEKGLLKVTARKKK